MKEFKAFGLASGKYEKMYDAASDNYLNNDLLLPTPLCFNHIHSDTIRNANKGQNG